MAANSLLAGGTQALCYLAYRRKDAVSAEDVARSLDTNPVVARKLLKALARKGLVRIKPGRHGGVALDRTDVFQDTEAAVVSVLADVKLDALMAQIG